MHPVCVSLTIAVQISCSIYTVIIYTRAIMVTGVLHSVWSELTPSREYPIQSDLWPHSFNKINRVLVQHLSSIYDVHAVIPQY